MSGSGDYISREAAIEKLDHFQSHLHTVEGTHAIGVAKTLIKEIPADDVLRHRGVYCSSRERIKWCKKYLSRIYRRRSKAEEGEV